MTKEEIEYTVIRNSVSTLAALCAGSEIKIIDMLTGYLWDEEEAGGIKRPLNKVVEDGQAKRCKKCAFIPDNRFSYCPNCGDRTPAT